MDGLLPVAGLSDFAFEWYPVFGVFFSAGLLVVFILLLRNTMGSTRPETVKASRTAPVLWEEVQGVDSAKEELVDVAEWLKDPKRFEKLGARAPRGVLLYGPPGTGKTMLARAVAAHAGVDFFAASGSSFVEMFVGRGAARIRRLFKEARENAPAIIFIDELDAVGAQRGSDISGERDQTLNQLLVEMDGFEGRDTVVVMAASNMLEKLDKALLRPGRFDRQVFVPPPDMRGRERILRVHSEGKPLAQDVELGRVARHTAGLTGADLANLCNEAAILAGRSRRDFIAQADFDNAFERVIAGLQSRKVMTDNEKRTVAWHEAGHALVSELLPTVDDVQKVSIVPRGKALGYTLNLPQEDRYLKTRDELIDYMKVLLAGRVAEQIEFGRITTGAADDLRKVTDISRAMVYDYGMGTTIRAHQLPGDDFTMSESLRKTRDDEVHAVAEEAYRGAHRLLSDHRDLLDEIAERLLANEVIEHKEIRTIMDRAPAARPPRRSPASEPHSRLGSPAETFASKPPPDPKS